MDTGSRGRERTPREVEFFRTEEESLRSEWGVVRSEQSGQDSFSQRKSLLDKDRRRPS